MKSFLLALQFLTIIPIKFKHINEKLMAQSMIYFPCVGFLLGLVLAGINCLLLLLNFPRLSIDIILVVMLIFLTGGIHLDGLADTIDAILSGRKSDEMLKIMRDPHIGAMGVLGIISIILLKISLLYSIGEALKPISLILMCSLSRWSLVFAMFSFPYAREEGKAKVFIQGINPKIFILSTSLTLFLVFASWKFKGLLILFIAAISSYITARFINKKISGITGDTLGMINEITEASVLFGVCILQRWCLWII
jgi:adenosylcobinamide-GDP ribazoletransferase